MTSQHNKEIEQKCLYKCSKCTIFCSIKFEELLSPSNRVTPLKTLCLDQILKQNIVVIPKNIQILPQTPFYKSIFTLSLPDIGLIFNAILPPKTQVCWGCSRIIKLDEIPYYVTPSIYGQNEHERRHKCNGRFESVIAPPYTNFQEQSGYWKDTSWDDLDYPRRLPRPHYPKRVKPESKYNNVSLKNVYKRTIMTQYQGCNKHWIDSLIEHHLKK